MIHGALIVGLGKIGAGYDLSDLSGESVRTHARAFQRHEGFNLLGGVDTDEAARRAFTQTYDCESFADLDAAMRSLQPDVVVVATSTPHHLSVIEKIIAYPKTRAILCEKPLAHDVRQAEQILRLCRAAHIDLFVNYIRRADPGVIAVKARLDSGQIRTPVKGVAWYSKGFLHNGSHFVDLLTFWLGEISSGAALRAGSRLSDGDSEPDVRLHFQKGDVVFLAAQSGFYSHAAIELLSPSGRLTYEHGGHTVTWWPVTQNTGGIPVPTISRDGERIASDLAHYQLNVAEHLMRALAGGDNTLCTGEEAARMLKTMCAVGEAA